MKGGGVNLAVRPFANQAPVLRVAVLLAIAAVVLLVVNVSSYRAYFSGAGQEARQRLEEIDGQLRALHEEFEALRGELADFDLETLNSQVEFLNHRIAERSFNWSRLFEDLGEVLPANVRIERLQPRIGDGRTVQLTLQGYARSEEGLLELIDAMFAHERFQQPSPSRESEREGQQQFNLSVVYLPHAGEPVVVAAGEDEE